MSDTAEKQTTAASAVVRDFLTCMERRDRDGLVALLTDDAVMECVLALDGSNDDRRFWDGREAARVHYTNAFAAVESIAFTNVEINQALDPDLVFVEASGSMTMLSGVPYDNRYVFRFDLRDGRIARLREYCNPVTAGISFGHAMPSW